MANFKKPFSILMLLIFILPVFASPARAEEVKFLQAAANMTSLENYRSLESIKGFLESSDNLKINYQMNFNSTVDNDSNPSSSTRLNANFQIVNQGVVSQDYPFKQMNISAGGMVTSINQTDLYLRLDDFKINFDGLSMPTEAGMVEDSGPFLLLIKEVENSINSVKGKWYHLNLDDMSDGLIGTTFLDQAVLMEFSKEFQANPEQAVSDLIEQFASSNGESLTAEDKATVEKAVSLFFETQFFNQLDVVSGPNQGFKFFNLNRAGVIGFVQGVSKLTGDEITADDLLSLRETLGKFSMAGIYRIDQAKGFIDNLTTRMKLRDIEELKNFEMNYRFKLLDTVSENYVPAPEIFEELGEATFM